MNKFQSIMNPTFINLEGLTFLYGPNSAGKSSIIDALALLKHIADGFPHGGALSYIDGFTQNQKDSFRASVGIEFIAGNMKDMHRIDKKIQQWDDTLTDKYSEEIFDFHADIAGKKVQIEIGDVGSTFKVAIAGEPLFEFTGGSDWSSDWSSDLLSEDVGISGQVKIYKNNKWIKSLHLNPPRHRDSSGSGEEFIEMEEDRPYHYRALVKNIDDLLIVGGIEFSQSPLRKGHVSLDGTVRDVLFFKYEESSPIYDSLGKDEREFLFNFYSKASPHFDANEKMRRQLYFDLESFAKNLDLIIEGFFFQMSAALKYSHVIGDRSLINSDRPIGISAAGKVGRSIDLGATYHHLSDYAEYLSRSEVEAKYISSSSVIRGDFINYCLKSYFHSLSGYRILSESSKITYTGLPQKWPEDGEIFFLSVLNPRRHILGFQDVGSGLSYMMPVLTSLWRHKFSIIEQPELHLHPKAQCEMGDVFISAYNKGSIAVVESHSEHLLLRILRRIRETTRGVTIPKELKLKAEDVSIYYFDPVAEGHTVVRKIRVDRHGELLDLWPGGFFSERDSELFT